MADNIELQQISGWSGAYPAGTIMATKQNADQSHSQRVVIDGTTPDGDPLSVEVTGNGVVDAGNTTTTPLGANGVFTGQSAAVVEYATIIVSITADQASKVDGVELQFSSDGVTFKTTDTYTYTNHSTCKTWAVQTVGPYFRLKYTNGAVAQTALNICTQLKKVAGVTSSHRVADNISGQDDAALTKTILMAERAGGTPDTYTNINATAAGNLKVSVDEILEGAPVPVAPYGLYADAFGRQRVSNTANRADVEFILDKQPLLVDDISTGSGTATHNPNPRDITLATGGTALADSGGMRLHYWVPYTPGNSQLIDITGVPDLADLGGTMYTFLRSSVTGTTTLTKTAQSAWVGNKATGADWSKSHIFGVDFQSLKVGTLRFIMVRNGVPIEVHRINNDNVRDSGYWQYASLPPYARIFNEADKTVYEIGYGDAANGTGFRYEFDGLQATATGKLICFTVKSEGGDKLLDMPGFPFATDPTLGAKTVGATLIPLISIRVAALFNGLANRSLIIPVGYSIDTTNPIAYALLYRPTLTGASWVPVDATYSGVEYDVTATAVTGGVRIEGDLLGSGTNQRVGEQGLLERTVMALGSGAASDILTLAAVRTSANNASVQSVLKWKEIR